MYMYLLILCYRHMHYSIFEIHCRKKVLQIDLIGVFVQSVVCCVWLTLQHMSMNDSIDRPMPMPKELMR